MKRAFDLTGSLLGLIILSPIFLFISLLVFSDGGWPILFRQARVCRFGKLFLLFKFRTMIDSPGSGEGSFDPGDISRITGTGKFLRRYKLDELPQLFNVLKGEMSIVGPRPEVEKWVAAYPERWKRILTIKPGITDISSIEFRDEETILSQSADPEKTYREIILPKKLDLYEKYSENNSLSGDIKIILKTFRSVYFK